MAWSSRTAWLSLTPEPERELPVAVATLRAGGPPSEGAVAVEQARVEKLVLHGSRRRWLAYIAGALALAERAEPASREAEEAPAVALDVVQNHNQLLLGLEPRGDA